MKISVLQGGTSAEAEVSRKSAKGIIKGIEELGHEYTLIECDKDFVRNILDYGPDLVYIAMHGSPGEDGQIQATLDSMGLPYNGSGAEASILAFDKALSKLMFSNYSISTSPFIVYDSRFEDGSELANKVADIGYPVVVKASRQGSTIGVYKVTDYTELKEAVAKALQYDDKLVIEKFIPGTELTISLLGNDDIKVLAPIEIVSHKDFYDYEAKYTVGGSSHQIPPRLDDKLIEKAVNEVVKAHKILGCRGLSRSEVICTQSGEVYVLEVNTLPGMTELSLYPDAARASGLSFAQMLSEIIRLGIENTVGAKK